MNPPATSSPYPSASLSTNTLTAIVTQLLDLTRSQIGQEMGAKYMLQGEIQSIEDGSGREKVVYYQIDATLVDLESNVKVWAGQHKIKKYIERKRFGV